MSDCRVVYAACCLAPDLLKVKCDSDGYLGVWWDDEYLPEILLHPEAAEKIIQVLQLYVTQSKRGDDNVQ